MFVAAVEIVFTPRAFDAPVAQIILEITLGRAVKLRAVDNDSVRSVRITDFVLAESAVKFIGVVPRAAVQCVGTGAADELIVALPAFEVIVAHIAFKRVVPITAIKTVGFRAACNFFRFGTAETNVAGGFRFSRREKNLAVTGDVGKTNLLVRIQRVRAHIHDAISIDDSIFEVALYHHPEHLNTVVYPGFAHRPLASGFVV